MRVLTPVQHNHAISIAKRPIWVLELMFTNGKAIEGVNDFYFATAPITSLTNGAIKPLPAANKWLEVLDPLSISGISQKLDPITGVSTIGGLSFKLIDVNKKVSEIIKMANDYSDLSDPLNPNYGYGLNRQFIDLYVIYEGDSWDDRAKIRRMQVVSSDLQNGVYAFTAQDIQRAARKTVFEPHKGSLITAMNATQTTLSVGNIDAGAFPLVAGYSHIKIGDEVMKVVSRNELGLQIDFTVVRAAANTVAAAHALNDEVSEVVRLYGDPLDGCSSLSHPKWLY